MVLGRLERRAASQRLSGTRAFLLARSGLEDAMARLDLGQDPAYGGEDWNGDGLMNAGPETTDQVFRPGTLEREICPVAQAMRPSFFRRVGGNPWTFGVNGRLRGCTGRFGGDSAAWAVKALPQGGFHVNGGDPERPATEGYNAVLRRVLGILAQAVDEEAGGIDGVPVSETDGWNLIELRPPTSRGWESFEQLRDLALGGSAAKLEALRPYLALRAWVDRKVIRPCAASTLVGRDCASWTEYKLAHLPVAPDFERLGGRIVGRAPVNLAWARRRKPALIALLGGLRGTWLDDSTAFDTPPRAGTIRDASISLTWAPTDDAHRIADQLVASASDLGTWQRFHDFCDTLSATQNQKDLLKANFNPNSGLNKFNPSAPLWKTVDKSDLEVDLLAYSTEFSLLPLQDHDLECEGRVLDASGRLLARRTLRALAAGPSAVRLDTQREFVCGDLGRLDLPGDERDLRLPGATPYLTQSQGADLTWGHKLPGLGLRGLGLQTAPEPCVDTGLGLSITAADWDGRIDLATQETALDDFYGVSTAVQDMKMLARFDTGFDLDEHDGAGFQNLTDVSQVSTAELSNSLLHATKPSTLYPDGAYAEWGRTPALPDFGNANGRRGVISFWFKRAVRGFHPFVKWTNRLSTADVTGADSSNQVFMFGYSQGVGGFSDGYTCFFESRAGSGDWDSFYKWEFHFTANEPMLPTVGYHNWSLACLYYNFQAGPKDATCEIVLQSGPPFNAPGSAENYSSVFKDNNSALLPDITVDDAFGAHTITLGSRADRPADMGHAAIGRLFHNGADATFDEFAIYDFGPTEPLTASLASGRFAEGRYYKESAYPALQGLRAAPGVLRSAGEWFSAPIDLGTARIRSLSWTAWVPKWLQAPFVFGPIGDPAPDPRIAFELAHRDVQVPAVAGADYKADLLGRPIDRMFAEPVWGRVDRAVRGPFRLHAVFQPNLATPASKPVLEPMSLDDVTIAYRDLIRPAFGAWREGE